MQTKNTLRPIAALLIASMMTTLAPVVAFAQPAPDTKAGATAPEDEALYACKKRTGQVAVTFKPETELKDLITWVMGFTCKNFILDPRIVSTGKKVTVIAPNKMSASSAYEVFLVALSTMGLTVVPKGNMMRIVESATAKSETVPIYKKGSPANQDQVIRYILRPSYAQTETLRSALDSIRSPAGNVTVAGSVLIITDYASQIRDMMTLARALDVPGNNEGIYTIAVKHADATALATKINEILGLGAGGGGGPAPGGNVVKRGQPAAQGTAGAATSDEMSSVPSKILVDDRTNTLIVVSSEAGYLRVKALVDRLDISLDTEGGTSIRVHPLENALAEELATTLNNAMGQGNQQQRQPGQPGARPPGAAVTPPGGAIGDLGTSLEGQVRVIGDKPTNSLIVMSSGRDYLAIKEVIRRLDQPRRQIFIEALILEVNLSKDLNLGTSSHGGLPFNNGDLIVAGVQAPSLKSLSVASLASLTGLIGGVIGSPLANSQTLLGTSIPSYGILVQALATQDNSNILSAPHVIAIDNEKAEFSVGNNIPYKAGLSFGGFGLPTGGAAGGIPGGIGQNIQREKLNLTLNITPHLEQRRGSPRDRARDQGSREPERRARPDVVGAQAEDAGRRQRSADGRHRRSGPGEGHLQREQGPAPRRHPDPRLSLQVLHEEQAQDEPLDPPHALHHQGLARSPGDPRTQDARARGVRALVRDAQRGEVRRARRLPPQAWRRRGDQSRRSIRRAGLRGAQGARRSQGHHRGRARVRSIEHRRSERAHAAAAPTEAGSCTGG